MKSKNTKNIFKLVSTLALVLVLTFNIIPYKAFALTADEITTKMDYGKKNEGAGKNGNSDEFNFDKTAEDGMFYKGLHYYDGGGIKRNMELGNKNLTGDPKPVIIFIHGGGWRVGDGGIGKYTTLDGKKSGEPINYTRTMRKKLADEGFASIWVDYTLGPNGVWRVFNDAMNAVENIRNNAQKYNIDPNRMIAWGDSAGGSIVTRIGASGKSGLAAVVGWSAPMNAFRDMEHSVKEMTEDLKAGNLAEIGRSGGLLIGLDHSTCVDTSSLSQDIADTFRLNQGFYKDVATHPTDYFNNPQRAMQLLETVRTDLPMGIRGLKSMLVDTPIDAASMGVDVINIDMQNLGLIIPSIKKSQKEIKKGTQELKENLKLETNSKTPKDNSDLVLFKERINNAIESLKKVENNVSFAKTNRQELEILKEKLPDDKKDISKDELQAVVDQYDEIATSLEQYIYAKNDQGKPKLVKDVIDTTSKNKKIEDSEKVKVEDFKTAYMSSFDQEDFDTYASALYVLSPEGSKLIKSTGETEQKIQEIQEKAKNITENSKQPLEAIQKVLTNSDVQKDFFNIGTKLAFNDIQGAAKEAANSQFMTVRVIGKCAETFIAMSPAVFADPKSPPMILLNGQSEPTVPAGDAYEMRDKLRQFGTKSDAVILPGDNHMGCDVRAIRPSVEFIKEITNPIPEIPTPPTHTSC